jgi:hypothetical protein
MLEGVNKKLEPADYCLQNLRTLASDAGGFAHIPLERQQAMRANLDCFFFEVMSAKDFFLQGINDAYGRLLPKDECTFKTSELKRLLNSVDDNASEVVAKIESLLGTKNSWLWQLNNYRNAATHRELLHMGYVAGTSSGRVEAHLFKDPEDGKKGNMDTEVVPYCEQALEKMTSFLKGLYCQLRI